MKASRTLVEADLARAMPRSQRLRVAGGRIASGDDIVALERFVGLTPAQFAKALGVSVATLRSWKRGESRPERSALMLLRIAAKHPRVLRENVASAA